MGGEQKGWEKWEKGTGGRWAPLSLTLCSFPTFRGYTASSILEDSVASLLQFDASPAVFHARCPAEGTASTRRRELAKSCDLPGRPIATRPQLRPTQTSSAEAASQQRRPSGYAWPDS